MRLFEFKSRKSEQIPWINHSVKGVHLDLKPKTGYGHLDLFSKLKMQEYGTAYDRTPRGYGFVDHERKFVNVWATNGMVDQNVIDEFKHTFKGYKINNIDAVRNTWKFPI
jgi:hypothetical protein